MRSGWRSGGAPMRAWCGPAPSRRRSPPSLSSSTIVLRRLVGADGKSRAFVNDEAASVGLLRELGDSLVEIQGQGEQRGLLDPATHRALLDDAAEHEVALAALADSWRAWRAARERAEDAARRLAGTRAEEDLLRHHRAELDALAPEGDEEERLGARRSLMQNAERLGEAIAEAIAEIDGEGGAGQALAALSGAAQLLELDPRALEEVEERLFALRALARKHSVTVGDLPRLRAELATRLGAIETGAE